MKKRSEVSENLKWYLSLIYKSEEDMRKDLEKCKELCKEMEEKYKGRLSSADAINDCINTYE